MGWLRAAKQAEPAERKGLWTQQWPSYLPPFGPLAPQTDADAIGIHLERSAADAFGRNELVYACVMEKATSAPEAPLRIYGRDGLGEPIEGHPLRQLITNPNPVLGEFELFELTIIHLELAGNAFWEIVRDNGGRPVELWPLRPDLVRIINPGSGGSYQYGFLSAANRLVPLGSDVIHFRYPNPLDPYFGQPPLRATARAVHLDNTATTFVADLLRNRAVPGTVVTTQQRVDEALADRLRTKWRQTFGGRGRGEVAFLQQGMDVKTLGLDLNALEFPDLRTIAETRICAAFGVPPILVGAKAGLDRSTFANYAEARRSFWEETLMPLQRRMLDVIVRRLLPAFDTPLGSIPRRVQARFDTSGVLALRESEQARWERATQALRAGGITVEDFRRILGLPPVPGADVFLRPAGVIPASADGTPTGPATPPAGDPAEPTEPTDRELTAARAALGELMRAHRAQPITPPVVTITREPGESDQIRGER